jgi:hypothetical protein
MNTSPFSQIGGWAMGGAVTRADPDATAVGRREVGFDLSFAAAWPPADPDGERHTAWVRDEVGCAASAQLGREGQRPLRRGHRRRPSRLRCAPATAHCAQGPVRPRECPPPEQQHRPKPTGQPVVSRADDLRPHGACLPDARELSGSRGCRSRTGSPPPRGSAGCRAPGSRPPPSAVSPGASRSRSRTWCCGW